MTKKTGYVKVGRYTYWTNYPVAVGDKVLLPASWVPGSQVSVGTITALLDECDYDGEVSSILGTVEEVIGK
jgi:hypothetical protein